MDLMNFLAFICFVGLRAFLQAAVFAKGRENGKKDQPVIQA
jgi:hypothetical protein